MTTTTHTAATVYAVLVTVVILLLVRKTDASSNGNKILVVGSANLDIILPVDSFPKSGETVLTRESSRQYPGGKGCNQAIAAARLLRDEESDGSSSAAKNRVQFCGGFGDDEAAEILKTALIDNHVELLGRTEYRGNSGHGYVLLKETGEVLAIVDGAANIHAWSDSKWEDSIRSTLENEEVTCILLQREIPEEVNLKVAQMARKNNVIVLFDCGGSAKPISKDLLHLADVIMPNWTELHNIASDNVNYNDGSDDTLDFDSIIDEAAGLVNTLQNEGANHVLVTLGKYGCIFIPSAGSGSQLVIKSDETGSISSNEMVHIPCLPVLSVLDETGAGDAFRAAFATQLLKYVQKVGESQTQYDLQLNHLVEALEFGCGAGGHAVQVEGAVPSLPFFRNVTKIMDNQRKPPAILNSRLSSDLNNIRGGDSKQFPVLFSSRLNSMKDRPEIYFDETNALFTPSIKERITRLSKVEGLGCIDLNFPEHFPIDIKDAKALLNYVEEIKELVHTTNLKVGAVCLRYPKKFINGAFTNPDSKLYEEAVDLTKQAAEVAILLGCNEVVIWSAYCGYDYPLQVDYDTKWNQIINAFQNICDAYPSIKFSLEFKPTDENTRWFLVPSTGAALLLVQEIDRANMGLTLDVGHMLMAGENPGQSLALCATYEKRMERKLLYGIQLNDGFTRLAAEDGLMFGSVHPSMAMEIMFYLQEMDFEGHLYFDTFPQRTDPILEAEFNIKRAKEFWYASQLLKEKKVEVFENKIWKTHDAVGALNEAEKAMYDVLGKYRFNKD